MTEAAGYCLVSSAKRDGMRLIAVVDRHEEHEGARGREPGAPQLRIQFLRDAQAEESRRPNSPCSASTRRAAGAPRSASRSDLVVTLPRGVAERVEYQGRARASGIRAAHVSDRVGVLRALVDGKVVAEAPIHPLADVPRGNFFRRIWDTILSWFA